MLRTLLGDLEQYRHEAASRYGERLRATIVHEHFHSGRSQWGWSGLSRTHEKRWSAPAPQSFVWDLERPKVGDQAFSKKCKFCNESVSIRVWSLGSIARSRLGVRRMRLFGAALFVLTLIGALPGFLNPDAPLEGFALVPVVSLVTIWPLALIGLLAAGADIHTEAVIRPRDVYGSPGLSTASLDPHPSAPDDITNHYLHGIECFHQDASVSTKPRSGVERVRM